LLEDFATELIDCAFTLAIFVTVLSRILTSLMFAARVEAAKTRRSFSFLAIAAPPFNHVFSIDTMDRQYKFCTMKEEEMLRWAQSLSSVMDEKKVGVARKARKELAKIYEQQHAERIEESKRIATATDAGSRRHSLALGPGKEGAGSEPVTSKQLAISKLVAAEPIPPAPGNLVVFVRRVVDARLPDPRPDDPNSNLITLKMLVGS